jgi:small subunit ribosomal protein S19
VARSIRKGPYIEFTLLKKIETAISKNDKKVIKTYSRRSTIFPECVGMSFAVYNGKKFVPFLVTENMIGHKFGEFAPTRTFQGHAEKKAAPAAAAKK